MSSSDSKFEMVAKTFRGLEDVLAKEVRELGGVNIEVLNRAVRFQGDKALMYKANLHLRTAIRILIPVIQATIKNQVDLYARVREFEWERYVQPGKTMAVDTFLNSSVFTNSHFVSLKTKDAIVDRVRDKLKRRPSVSTGNPDIFINVHLSNNTLTVSVDTSGPSLHKRGYRKGDFEAPLNEALAAGLLLLSGWDGSTDFYDPMCGSGTLGIEAALIARKIPPGIFRTKFGFENSPEFDADLWEDIFDGVEEKKWDGKVVSSDISRQAIQIAQRNAREASVHKNIQFLGVDFRKYPPVEDTALTVINPPYGQRLVKPDIIKFYKEIGNTLKNSFVGSNVWILSGNLDAMKYIGLKPTDKKVLYNGQLECRYNQYTIYSGSRKKKNTQNKAE